MEAPEARGPGIDLRTLLQSFSQRRCVHSPYVEPAATRTGFFTLDSGYFPVFTRVAV